MIPQELLVASHKAFEARDLLTAKLLAERGLAHADIQAGTKGRTRFHLGMVARELGDTTMALQQFRAFLAEAQTEYPELAVYDGLARYYIALTLRQTGQYSEAEDEYKRSIAAFLHRGEPNQAHKAQQNLTWTCCLAGNSLEARRYHEDDGTVAARLNQAFIAFVEGAYAETRSIADQLLSENPDDGDKAQAAWLCARTYLAEGRFAEAQQLAELAACAAVDAGDATWIRDAAALRHQIVVAQKRGA